MSDFEDLTPEDRCLNILYQQLDRYLEGRGGSTPLAEFLTYYLVQAGLIPENER